MSVAGFPSWGTGVVIFIFPIIVYHWYYLTTSWGWAVQSSDLARVVFNLFHTCKNLDEKMHWDGIYDSWLTDAFIWLDASKKNRCILVNIHICGWKDIFTCTDASRWRGSSIYCRVFTTFPVRWVGVLFENKAISALN